MKTPCWTVLVAVVLALIGPPRRGFAQDAGDVGASSDAGEDVYVEDDPAIVERVQQHFDRGATLYKQGDYEGAIHEFEAGNALIPNAIFLYNISLAEAKLGRHREALARAEEAQEMGLPDEDANQNAARIAALRTSLEAQDVAQDVHDHPSPSFFSGLSNPLSTIGWVGVASVSLGTLAMLGTLQVDLSLGDTVDAFRQAAADGDAATYDDLRQQIKRRQTWGRVLLFGGAGLVAAGAAAIVYDLFFAPKTSDATPADEADEEPGEALFLVCPVPGGGVTAGAVWTFR